MLHKTSRWLTSTVRQRDNMTGKKEFFKAPGRTEQEMTAYDKSGGLFEDGGRGGLPDIGWMGMGAAGAIGMTTAAGPGQGMGGCKRLGESAGR